LSMQRCGFDGLGTRVVLGDHELGATGLCRGKRAAKLRR
jgi:hypothetical protein